MPKQSAYELTNAEKRAFARQSRPCPPSFPRSLSPIWVGDKLRRSDDEYEERWTGSYIFENEWQSFRTRKNRNLELTSAPHTYSKTGRYTVAVKVIDIFGNDTMVLVPVNVG